jgi:hypothetical protein
VDNSRAGWAQNTPHFKQHIPWLRDVFEHHVCCHQVKRARPEWKDFCGADDALGALAAAQFGLDGIHSYERNTFHTGGQRVVFICPEPVVNRLPAAADIQPSQARPKEGPQRAEVLVLRDVWQACVSVRAACFYRIGRSDYITRR